MNDVQWLPGVGYQTYHFSNSRWLWGSFDPRNWRVERRQRHTGDARLDQDLPNAGSELIIRCRVPDASDRRPEVVHCHRPSVLPVTREEIALLRAFLGAEISAIVCGEG
jgi:hypothetical protein